MSTTTTKQQLLMMKNHGTNATRTRRFFPSPTTSSTGKNTNPKKSNQGQTVAAAGGSTSTSLPPVKLLMPNSSTTSTTPMNTKRSTATTPILPSSSSSSNGVTKKRRSPYHTNRVATSQNQSTSPLKDRNSYPVLPEQLPCDKGKLTLVLDVDETLVHSKLSGYMEEFRQDEERKCSVGVCDEFQIILKDGEKVRVNKRPGLDKFLQEMSEFHEIIAYTAGLEDYAKPLLDWIDPENKFFRHRLYRDACVFQRGYYVKDLERCNRDLAKCVLVDNNAMCFLPQLSNGIPISSFYDDPNDTALSVLASFLARLRGEKDVRPFLNRSFNLETLLRDHREQIIG